MVSNAVMPVNALRKEFDYYLAHQDELVAKYDGRVLVIKNESVIGDYASEPEAIAATSKIYPMGTFLVQRCTPGTDSYTGVYHSRFSV
jgi:hypothetical protein